MSGLHIALFHPEIPQNTGNIGRLCLATGSSLHLVHPLSFDTSDRAVRRAGLDYWHQVSVVEHPTEGAFWEWVGSRKVHAFSRRAEAAYTNCPFTAEDVLLFGRETKGLPSEVLERVPSWSIPMIGPTRSLNLANSVAVVVFQALQQVKPELFV